MPVLGFCVPLESKVSQHVAMNAMDSSAWFSPTLVRSQERTLEATPAVWTLSMITESFLDYHSVSE
jgi:hypothetical protein